MTTEQKARSMIEAYDQILAMLPSLGGGLVDDWVEVGRAYLEALGLLRQMEWDDISADDEKVCSICIARESEGHRPGCRLAAVLGGK